MQRDLFESAVRRDGKLAGVFEFDDNVGYFYLYNLHLPEGQRVIDSIRVLLGPPQITDADVNVRWDRAGERVALFIRGVQWAVFNCIKGSKFGGGPDATGKPSIPPGETFD